MGSMKPKRLKYFSIPNQIYYVFAQLLGRSKGPPFGGSQLFKSMRVFVDSQITQEVTQRATQRVIQEMTQEVTLR